jgi:hypothetical protein
MHSSENYAVGAAPLQLFVDYVNDVLNRYEETLTQKVFEAGRVTQNPKKISASHVADVLWEAYEPFRPCVNGRMCHCRADFGFVMMEYVDKAVYDAMKASGRRSSAMQPGYCYICFLFFVACDYFDKVNGNVTLASIHYPFCHIVEQIGEYKKDAMLQSVSVYSETDLEKTVAEANYTHTGATNANVLPFRRYVVTDYEPCTRDVLGGSVRGLREKSELMFTEILATFNQIPPVAPFHYAKTRVAKTSTLNVLDRLFGADHGDFTSGGKRAMTNNALTKEGVIRSDTGVYTKVTSFALPRMWCISKRADIVKCGLTPAEFVHEGYFPWSAIFVADLRKTVRALPEILKAGRISLVKVLREKVEDLCVTADLTTDPSVFEMPLMHANIRCRLLYVAYRVKLVVLQTIKMIYPMSPSSRRDPKMHMRLGIFITWLRRTYGPHIGEKTFDKDLPDKLLDELAVVPVPYHYYDTDINYHEVRTSMEVREMPFQVISRRFPKFAYFFRDFNALLKDVNLEFSRRGNARRLFGATKIGVFMPVSVTAEEEMRSYGIQEEEEDKELLLVDSKEHSIYLTALYRVNLALKLHDATFSKITAALERIQREDNATSSSSSSSSLRQPTTTLHSSSPSSSKKKEKKEKSVSSLLDEDEDDDEDESSKDATLHQGEVEQEDGASQLRDWRRVRYCLRLFAFTHLNMLQRMYDLDAFSNGVIRSRVETRGPNYVLRHFDETYPFPGIMPHEGMMPNFGNIIHCIPFPNPAASSSSAGRAQGTATASSFDVFGMLAALFPRFQHPKPPIKRHVKLCREHVSYMTMAARAVELMLLGAYEHADHMPTYSQCIGIHRTHNSDFRPVNFFDWQMQRSAITILAMREFLVFSVKLAPAYESYLTYNFPFWVEFSKKVYGSADLVRRLHGGGYGLGVSQHAVFTIFKASVDQSTLPGDVRAMIEKENLFEPINFQRTRKRTKVDPLRELCRRLTTINKDRAKMGMHRAGLTREMAYIIERRVRLIKPATPIDLAWLQEFNLGLKEPDPNVVITEKTLKMLSLAFMFIGLGDAWSAKADRALQAIPLRDYEVVDAFFFHLHIQYCIASFDLDDETKQKQVEAIRTRYSLTEEMMPYISKCVTSLIIAPCCGSLRSYNIHETDYPSYGNKHCGIDDSSGAVVDCFSTNAVNDKKLYRVGTLHENNAEHALWLKQFTALKNICERIIAIPAGSHQKKFNSQSKCGTVPVMAIPLLGKVVEMTATRISKTGNTEPTTKAYAICTVCGSVSEFSVRMFGINGFNCWRCDVKHTEPHFTPKCVFCSQSIKLDKHNYYQKMAIDDREGVGDFTIKKFYVCYHCYKCLTTGYRAHGRHIYTATEMMLWKKFSENGMAKRVIIRSGQDLSDYLRSVPQKPKHLKKSSENPKKAPKYE